MASNNTFNSFLFICDALNDDKKSVQNMDNQSQCNFSFTIDLTNVALQEFSFLSYLSI
jgi:hypothetical protein